MTPGQHELAEGGWARHPLLAIDLSNTIEAPSISGVQRVAIGLTRALTERWPVELLDGRDGTLAPAGAAALARLRRLERGPSGRHLLLRAETRWRRHRPTRRHRTALDDALAAGDVLLDLEPSWHAPQPRRELLPHLVSASVGTAAVIYDLLPISDPQWFPTASVDRFTAWFDAHAAAGSTLLAISAATADCVAERTGHRPAVIRLGRAVTSDEHQAGAKIGILMVGTVEPRKGHEIVLDALDRLGAAAPVVDVVGRPGWAPGDLLDRLAAHPKVRWHRAATDHDLHELWDLTGLLLQPSLGEGYGLPVAEALQRGIAVAATDLPVLHEVTRGQATHLPPDPSGWAEVIAAFAADPDGWPTPEPLPWPSWSDGADDVVGALRTAGRWPDPGVGNR